MDLSERLELKIQNIENKLLRQKIQNKIDSKTKPYGALGFLEDIAMTIGLIQQSSSPVLKKPTILIFAADHGVVKEAITAFPREVTYQMVLNFLHEGAAVNIFARENNLALRLVDVGVDHDFEGTLTYWLHHGTKVLSRKVARGTRNFVDYPAMHTAEAEKAIHIGGSLVDAEFKAGCNTIGFGDIAIGNKASVLAVCCAMFEKDAYQLSDPDLIKKDKRYERLLEIVNKALRSYPKTHDPLTILTLYGGLEIAAITGAILQAAHNRMLILIDDFTAATALLVAERISPEVLQYCLFCQRSDEVAYQTLLKYFNKKTILNTSMTLGEGCGVALAYPIIKNAVAFLNDMSSFEDAGISPET